MFDKKINMTFGYKSIWVAIKGTSSKDISEALRLTEIKKVDWNTGLQFANQLNGRVAITEEYFGWCFVIGISLPDISYAESLLEWLAKLSYQLGELYYFCSYRTVGTFGFVKAINGIVERAYGVLGDQGKVILNVGDITDAEKKLEYVFASNGDELWDERFTELDEEEILDLATQWSIHPEVLIGCIDYGVTLGNFQSSEFYLTGRNDE